MTNQAVILAGGLGSRLGPITAQRSKALVTIGQRPHLVHQVLLLRDANVSDVVVVVSPDTTKQIRDVLDRAGLGDVKLTIQNEPLGPVNALLHGLYVLPPVESGGVFMLMSDSFIDEPLAFSPLLSTRDWVGVAGAPFARSFCYEVDHVYVDGPVEPDRWVTIGVNYFASRRDATSAAEQVANYRRAKEFGEIPMSEFFNAYSDLRGELTQRIMRSWLDVGDVNALAHAHRSRFISRSHHKLELDAAGVLTKIGDGEAFERQANWLWERQEHGNHREINLFPRVFGYSLMAGESWYTMEYVDLPTLSELWLYWPGRPDVWQALLRNVMSRLHADLWAGAGPHVDELTANILWFVDKTRDRLAMRGLPEWHAVAEPLLDEAEEFLRNSVHIGLVRGHGDLNFSNILYSLNTGMIKLIDPRGDHLVPWLYELAKLRYSYHGGFAAITHGLATRDGEQVTLLPSRTNEIVALDDVLSEYVGLDLLTVCEGCMLLAGAPLHDGEESQQLFWRGVELLRSVLT